MDHDVALVLAGGLIALVSSVAALFLQRRWMVHDRRNAVERESLDLAMRALLAWQAVALGVISGKANAEAEKRLQELDVHWEADPRLIPEQKAATELLRICKLVILTPRSSTETRAGDEWFDRIIELGDIVLDSARSRRRDLA